MVIVKPATIIGWQRKSFKLYWKWKSRNTGGRPKVSKEVRDLIKRMATENRWGAPRIHGELIHLGFNISESTVGRYIPKKRRSSESQVQSWRTFLKNHMPDTVSIDFFTIPTVQFKNLYGFVVLSHHRRKILWVDVTYHPLEFWAINQFREAV